MESSNGTPSAGDDIKAKAQAVASRAADQAGVVAAEAAEKLKAAAKDQWQLLRERAPEIIHPTPEAAAESNARRTEANIAFFKENPSMIASRLDELDTEWDTTRVLQVVTSGLTLGAFWLSLTKSRAWSLLTAILAGGALHHGLVGQSPADDLVRRLGFRTRDEIEFERRALLRIDFVDNQTRLGEAE
ncbi:MAG: hypothetical protein AAGI46_05125 [Planctomycetota bacterium]